MLTVDEARVRVLATVVATGAEAVGVREAAGRLLAEDVFAELDLPPFDNSAMDGYAVRADDVRGASPERPVRLRVGGVVAAGRVGGPLGGGEAAPIMTGAPLPAGADAVIAIEDTDGASSGLVEVRTSAQPGKHVRRRGESVAVGQRVLTAGTVVRPGVAALLAALGRTTVQVARRPRVAIVSTGDELVAPGLPLGPGQIHGSNGVAIAALVAECGAVPVDLGHVADDPALQRERFSEALAVADVVVSTGGVSVGLFDHTKGVLSELGVEPSFWRVKMKPGKPLAFGVRGAVPVFGLPGNPVSCMVSFVLFVRPWLRLAMGDPRPHAPTMEAVCGEDFVDPSPRARFLRAELRRGPHGWEAWSAGKQSSGAAIEMARADGLVAVAEGAPAPRRGERVQVWLLATDVLAAPVGG